MDDLKPVSGFAWAGLAACDLDFGSAGYTRVLYYAYALFLFCDRHDARAYLGDIPL